MQCWRHPGRRPSGHARAYGARASSFNSRAAGIAGMPDQGHACACVGWPVWPLGCLLAVRDRSGGGPGAFRGRWEHPRTCLWSPVIVRSCASRPEGRRSLAEIEWCVSCSVSPVCEYVCRNARVCVLSGASGPYYVSSGSIRQDPDQSIFWPAGSRQGGEFALRSCAKKGQKLRKSCANLAFLARILRFLCEVIT